MAQLSSPGVSVSVIDESFYTPAAPGTVPLIIVASEESKQNGAGTGTAPGTLKANAGQVYLLTSQKDLSDTFGTPIFKTDANNNAIHAGELNEYGLQAAYSYLGVSNRAYVVRADLDLAQLTASATAPAGLPEDGTIWFDTANTKFGIFEWNAASADVGGQSFTVKYPTVITDTAKVVDFNGGDYTPKPSIGAIGDYAIVAVTGLNKLWFKKPLTNTAAGTWVEVGSTNWTKSWPTVQATAPNSLPDTSGIFNINGQDVGGNLTVDALVAEINANATLSAAGIKAAKILATSKFEIYSTGTTVSLTGTGWASSFGVTAGDYAAPALNIKPHTDVPLFKLNEEARPTGSVWVKTTSPNLGASWSVKVYNAVTGAWSEKSAPLYRNGHSALAALDPTGGGLNLAKGSLYVKFNDDEGSPELANFKIYARANSGATAIKSVALKLGTLSGTATFTIQESVKGSTALATAIPVTYTFAGQVSDADNFLTVLTAALSNSKLVATKTTANEVVITHTQGGDFRIQNDPGAAVAVQSIFPVSRANNFYANASATVGDYIASLWTEYASNGAAVALASPTALTTTTADGQLWYNSIVDEVDILMHNGTTWVGYKDSTANAINAGSIDGYAGTDPNGPIVSATKPTTQSTGNALANGDLWISTADLENFPQIYRYNDYTKKWVLLDTADQTTENGVLFADARAGTSGGTETEAPSGTIAELLSSNFLDFDAPDPALYPKGMLLWNLRRSGFNVKKFVRNSVDILAKNMRYQDEAMTDYYPHRWVTESGNQENGAGTFGRKAQRKVVVQKLQALVNANQQIRDEESRIFNLIACPGYPELVGEMLSLNYDRGLTAFVVCDTPARLTPDATSLSNWGNNVKGALEDNDQGLVSSDEYIGFFYPWGYTSDNVGNNIVVPPSHMMLRTIALSDQVSYPWFAPAGTRRGGITNATAVGYVTAEGEFQSVALNNGQRDTLASIKVNPLTFITGTGLVNYGQYTRAKNASALDRINVARLVIYLRRQFAQLAKPYVFEPNDKITRDEIKGAANSLLLELVGQRALYDYLVVCDETNNTPSRIDRNELYLDVAIEPVKAVEFIYIPLRLKNTGEIKGLQ